MKKIILSFAALLVAASTVFAGFKPVDPSFDQSLQQSFRGAKAVNWINDNGYARATFEYGGSRTLAWFNSNGELLGYVRDLLQQQLPLAVISKLNKKYAGAEVVECYELNNALGSFYKVSVKSNGKASKVTFRPDGSIESVEKVSY